MGGPNLHMRTSKGAPGSWTYLYTLYILLMFILIFSGHVASTARLSIPGRRVPHLCRLQVSSFPYKGCKLFLTRFEGLTCSYMCAEGSGARLLFTLQCNF